MTKEQFDTTNQELRATRLSICDLQEEAEAITVGALREADRRIAEWDAQQTADIARQTQGESGKPTFSNAEARAAELAIRQTESDERRNLDTARTDFQAQLAAIRNKIARAQVEASFLSADVQYAIHQGAAESGLRSILMEVASNL